MRLCALWPIFGVSLVCNWTARVTREGRYPLLRATLVRIRVWEVADPLQRYFCTRGAHPASCSHGTDADCKYLFGMVPGDICSAAAVHDLLRKEHVVHVGTDGTPAAMSLWPQVAAVVNELTAVYAQHSTLLSAEECYRLLDLVGARWDSAAAGAGAGAAAAAGAERRR